MFPAIGAVLAAPASTAAGVVTSVASVITASAVLIGALTVFIPILRTTKRVEAQVATVHTIVNQQHTDQERYNIALVQLLKLNGIEVPIDQSKPVPGHGDAQPGEPPAIPLGGGRHTSPDAAPAAITLTGEMTQD